MSETASPTWATWAEWLQRADPQVRDAFLLRVAHHEAGHALGYWWIARMEYLGRHYMMPDFHCVAISLDGEPITGIPGGDPPVKELWGVVRARPLVDLWEPVDYYTELGLEAFREDYDRFRRLRARADMIIYMAGPIAERLHDGEPFEDAWHWRQDTDPGETGDGPDPWGDHAQVEFLIRYLGRRWRLHLDRAFQTADAMVREHWSGVAALAEVLVERGRVDGAEVFALFDEMGR